MGRLKIKKKDVVIPFRETLVYRSLLLSAALAVFIVALYAMMVSVRASSMVALIIWGVIAAAAIPAIVYNLGHLRDAKLPARTAKRLKRR